MTSQNVPPVNQQPGQKVWLRRLITGFLLLAIPVLGILSGFIQPVHAKPAQAPLPMTVIINEVAWMGTGSTTALTNDEWIELYNPGSSPVSLTNWSLISSDTSFTINLSGSIPGNGYFLLERTDDTAVNNITADLTYTGALSNTGSSLGLELRDSGGALIDTAKGNTSGWPAGIASPSYCSMERRGPLLDEAASWTTSTITTIGVNISGGAICGSPKAQNSQFVTPTFTPTLTSTPVGARRVVVNEVAWGGTQADGSMGQWIELHNPNLTNSIDITGWHLISNNLDIALLPVSIPANGYLLLGSTNNGSPIFQSLPIDQAFSGSLSLSGDTLRLYAPGGELVDTANLDGGSWPAGTGFVPYRSMERNGSNPDTDAIWISFAGTPTVRDRNGNFVNGSPGQANWSDGMTQTPSPTPTATGTATVTPTVTITSTATITSTRTVTPTITLTPINSPTATQTATSTATPQMDVLINEVAWSGTKDINHSGQGANAEWIELYNPGPLSITIEGWTLKFSGYTITLPVGSSISAGGYYLLERGSDTDISNIAADYVYSSSIALSDSGTSISLWNGSVLIDTANGNGGSWPAGNSTNKCSMERASASSPDMDATWVTPPTTTQVGTDASGDWVCGTPKNVNWAYSVTLTPSPTSTLTRTLTPTKSATVPTPTKTATPRKSATPTRTYTPTPNRATPEPIILNEFLPQPKSDYNGDGKVDSGDEFIELKNLSTTSISISGYKLDDQDGDSLPYTIQNITMQPGQRLAFFASQTGILLSTGGDSVRLYKPSASLPADAFTYGVIKIPNQSWCRLPDNKQYFALKWTFGCEPTVNEVNKLAESVFFGNRVEAAICLSKNLPSPVYQAECEPLGLEMWSQALWDELPPDFPRFFEFETQEFIVE